MSAHIRRSSLSKSQGPQDFVLRQPKESKETLLLRKWNLNFPKAQVPYSSPLSSRKMTLLDPSKVQLAAITEETDDASSV